jgi:nucleotide-binding universal stress UspA family protein
MAASSPPDGAPVEDVTACARVVVGIDGSAGSRAALREALLEAGRRGAALDVVAAYPVVLAWTVGMPVDVRDLDAVREDARSRARGFLDEVRAELLVEDAPGLGEVPVELVVEAGPPADVLVRRADGAELLVVGSRGRGAVRGALLGSVGLHCITHAPCPVVVVHETPVVRGRGGRSVVVGVDGSPASTAALREAVAWARDLGSDLDVVATWSPADSWTDAYPVIGPDDERVDAVVRGETEQVVAAVATEERAAGRPVPRVRLHVEEGRAREVLLRQAEDAAALVVGSRGHGAVRGLLLGSVALHCAVHAGCPVVVVHPQDRPAPTARVAAAAGAPA